MTDETKKPADEKLDTKGVMARARVSESTVRGWKKRGLLPPGKRWTLAEVDAAANAPRKVTPRAAPAPKAAAPADPLRVNLPARRDAPGKASPAPQAAAVAAPESGADLLGMWGL